MILDSAKLFTMKSREMAFAATEKGKTMRLIDADALLERFKSMKLNCKTNYAIAKNIGKIVFEIGESTVDICSEEVKRAPTIDAVPVVHGRWAVKCESHLDQASGEFDEDYYIECSECGRKVWDISQDSALFGDWQKIFNDFPYCHCGAKMDGGNDG